ncbi:MAG: GAF domain-containing protein [Chloroflexi bacterium]|nr:GAF domain-containing protein [Chloroflexota bacterium]
MPPDESQKRVEKLFSELERIARQPLSAQEGASADLPTGNDSMLLGEIEALNARLCALEAQLRETEERAAAAEAELAARVQDKNPLPGQNIVYEKEEVGFAYHDDRLLPFQLGNIQSENLDSLIETPLTAGGQKIGGLKVKPASEREWTADEEALAQAVARQVSLQVQNLRLLNATERARAEAQAATRRFTHESWQEFLDGIHNSERIGYAYNQAEVAPMDGTQADGHDLRETIDVLDEQVGDILLKTDPARPLTEEDKTLVSTVARQVAQQVESLRLLAEASRARADAEEATRRLSRESWQTYAQRAQSTLGYVYDSNRVSPLEGTSSLGSVSFVQPLTVRGETIGRLAMLDVEHVTPEAAELAGAIAERVSAQLERLRLTEEIERRAAELATVATVSTTASTVLDPDELLQQVVNLTRESFNLYHVHIYLADDSWQTLLLAAGAGEIGQQMVASGHAIPMDAERSLVARALRERTALIVNDVRTEPDFLPNPFLPETRAELAVPMLSGEKAIGVFDVQSEVIGRFTDEDAKIYSTLAAQVAIALQNARLYMEQSATVTQLRELDRLKSSFLANMSHELRTPLNSILGFSDVMLEELDGPLTANMDNDLRLIRKNGQHLLHLINDVLDMAKIESGRMNLNLEKFRVHETLEEVTSITSTLASEKNLALFIEDSSDQEVEILADRTRIRQVMINLVNNAIKFTETGKISIQAKRKEDLVLISVRDTGIGIPPDKLEAVFQEFTQVDTSTTRKAGGTGLGLPISRRLVEMHGGRLWAESSGIDGEGCIFYVELPLEARTDESIEKTER